MQPNGRTFTNLPYTWIPIYTGNYKTIILNSDLILTTSDLTKIINENYDTNSYTTSDRKSTRLNSSH